MIEQRHRITQLTASNIKRLKAVNIEPDGSVVRITGKNGAGKSSALQAIWLGLEYKAANAGIGRVIRDGEDQAAIRIEIDGPNPMVVERTFTRKEDGEITTKIEVRTPQGAKFPKAQTVLSEILGELSFQPLKFATAKPADQVDMLLVATGKKRELLELDIERGKVYEERTDVNRRVRDLEGELRDTVVPEDAPAEPVSVVALTDELEAARAHNRQYDDLVAKRLEHLEWQRETLKKAEEHDNRIAELKAEIVRLEEKSQQLKDDAQDHAFRADKFNDELKVFVPINVEAIQAKIANAETLNTAHQLRKRRDEVQTSLNNAQKQSSLLTEQIESVDRQKADIIKQAKLPVEGLTIADGQVMYQDRPLVDASSAEKIRVSTAIAIALAPPPKLGLAIVEDGSLIDDDGLKILEQMARENDFQIFIERVDDNTAGAIVIEEGEISGGAAVESKAA